MVSWCLVGVASSDRRAVLMHVRSARAVLSYEYGGGTV